MRESNAATARWVLPSALFLLLLPLHVGLLPWAFDDAYIHLRVAHNLAAGNGPYFNAGHVVNSSSAPAWTVLLAVFSLFGASTLWLACFNAVVTVAGAAAFTGLLEDLGKRPPGTLLKWSFAFAYCGVVHYSSAGLMETPLALLILGVAIRSWLRDHAASFLLFSLACFLRLEFAVFAVLFVAATSVSGHVNRIRAWAYAVLGALPFILFLLVSFGSLVPHTAVAKTRVYSLTLADAWNLLVGFATPGGGGFGATFFKWVAVPACAVFLAVSLREGRASESTSRTLPTWLLGAGACTIPLAYLATRTLIFPWYVPLFVIPGLLFVVSVVQRARSSWLRLGVVLFALLPFAADLAPSVIALFEPGEYRYFAVNARVRKYREIGARLSEAYPGARLLSSEVGGLGYEFEGEVLDGAGLISPDALAHHPMQIPAQRRSGLFGSIPAAYVDEMQPELIVSMDVFAEDWIRSDWRKNYRLYREPLYVESDLSDGAPGQLWGSTSMNVFVRKDLPPLER